MPSGVSATPSESFNSFPVAARSPRVFTCWRRFHRFLSILSQLLRRRTWRPASTGSGAPFNSFPVAARAAGAHYKARRGHLSILSQLLREREARLPRGGLPLSILSQLLHDRLKAELDRVRGDLAFNSFPVAAWPRRARRSSSRSSLSILSQLLRGLPCGGCC